MNESKSEKPMAEWANKFKENRSLSCTSNPMNVQHSIDLNQCGWRYIDNNQSIFHIQNPPMGYKKFKSETDEEYLQKRPEIPLWFNYYSGKLSYNTKKKNDNNGNI